MEGNHISEHVIGVEVEPLPNQFAQRFYDEEILDGILRSKLLIIILFCQKKSPSPNKD